MPDDYYGEAIAAYVTLRAGAVAVARDADRQLSGHVPRYRIPAHLRIIDALPTTPSGKIQKYRLVEMFNADVASVRRAAPP